MSPVPKKSRLEPSEESTVTSAKDIDSGVIRFEVDNVSTLYERYSSDVEVGVLPWRALACKEKHDGEDQLSVYLESMEHKSTGWSIVVESELTLINRDNSKYETHKDTKTFEHGNTYSGVVLIAWEELMDEEMGFIKDDKITIEIRFSILNMNGIWFSPRFNSSSSRYIMISGSPDPVKKQSLLPSAPCGNIQAADENSSGFISFEIGVIDIENEFTHSAEIEVHGTRWSLGVGKDGIPPYLEVYLYHHHESETNIWSFDISASLSLINILKSGTHKTAKFNLTFNNEDENNGVSKYMLWDDLINEEKGFIKDGKITIEVRFTLSNFVGIRRITSIDFSDAKDPRHDVALLIEKEKVYVGKQILAFHSPFFNAMFYGYHIERNKKEIELKEVDHKVFIEMLNLIYPSYQKITEDNAESLLKMADYFQIKIVIDKVEQFLIDSIKLDIPAKLKVSDQYRLVKLQDHCLSTLKTAKDIKNMETTEGYKALSDKAKSTLMDKTMKLLA